MIQTGGKAAARNSRDSWVKLIRLTLTGGMAFWAASIATSLLPIAAEYRAALSNWSAQTVWIASLLAGLLISSCVSYLLVRYAQRIPAKSPIVKSLMVSCCAFIVVIILVDVPVCFQGHGNSLHCFLIGLMFNAARFLLLGAATGCQYRKLARKELS